LNLIEALLPPVISTVELARFVGRRALFILIVYRPSSTHTRAFYDGLRDAELHDP
jgi:hypothetical protein